MILTHLLVRKKVYDFEDGAMESTWIYGRLHLTMAFLETGQHQVISGYRMGRSGAYIDGPWTRVTMFIKMKKA